MYLRILSFRGLYLFYIRHGHKHSLICCEPHYITIYGVLYTVTICSITSNTMHIFSLPSTFSCLFALHHTFYTGIYVYWTSFLKPWIHYENSRYASLSPHEGPTLRLHIIYTQVLKTEPCIFNKCFKFSSTRRVIFVSMFFCSILLTLI